MHIQTVHFYVHIDTRGHTYIYITHVYTYQVMKQSCLKAEARDGAQLQDADPAAQGP